MNTYAHRRRESHRVKMIGGATVAAVVAGGAIVLGGSAMAGAASTGGTAGKDASEAAQDITFAPYGDTGVSSFDLTDYAKKSGVKNVTLANVVSKGDGCETRGIEAGTYGPQIEKLRQAGGDVRVSFGGVVGDELALTCDSTDDLAKAYGKVIDDFKLTKVDFDIEGTTGQATADSEANTRRAQAIAQLQKSHKDLDVSFSLAGRAGKLDDTAVDLLKNAKKNGVKVSSVNVMTMNYQPALSDDMGKNAIDTLTAAQKQVKEALGIGSDTEAWKTLAVTPEIGRNDEEGQTFGLDDAKDVAKFAKEKGLAWISMWSSTRDKACKSAGDPAPTCSGVEQRENDFAKAFTG